MQLKTKYRLTIGALSVAVVGLGTYSALLHAQGAQLRSETALASQHADESAKKVREREGTITKLEDQARGHQAEQTTMRQAVAAFSRQADACFAVKQQLHIKE